MHKSNKKKTLVKSLCKFPLLSEFRKQVCPKPDQRDLEKKKEKPRPIVPPYLRELSCKINPYTAIKIESTSNLKLQEQKRKIFEQKVRSYPIHHNVSREVRLIYNANFKLNAMKYSMDLAEASHETPQSDPVITLPRVMHSRNVDFVLDTRRACLLELAIKVKEKQILDLDKMAEVELAFINEQYKCLFDDRRKEDEFLKSVCEKTSGIMKLIHEKAHKKHVAINKLEKVRFKLARLTVECIHLESEFVKFSNYKEFLKKCRSQIDKKNLMERTSLIGRAQIDFLLHELEAVKDNSEAIEDKTNEASTTDNVWSSNLNSSQPTAERRRQDMGTNGNENNTNQSNKDLLRCMKTNLFIGFDNVNNENVEELSSAVRFSISTLGEPAFSNEKENVSDSSSQDIFFKEPQELVNVLNDLEVTNLSLIENVQEQEEACDTILKKTDQIKGDMESRISVIDNQIMAEKGKLRELNRALNLFVKNKSFLLKFNEVDRYKDLVYFDEKEVKTVDEIVEFFASNIAKLYISVFPNTEASTTSTKDMLRELEIEIDSLFIEAREYDKPSILQAMKKLEEDRRVRARIRRKQSLLNMEKKKLQKAIDEANRPPRYRFGRKVIYRSKPVERIIKVSNENVEDVRQEEYSFFFT